MPLVRTLLLIADMSGYTEYMRTHRFSLAHAEVNTTRLLKKVIDAAPGFKLIELEGDAAFLSRDAESLDPNVAVTEVLQAAVTMRRAFHSERAYVAANLCPCAGCKEVGDLKLKFVAHVADVATQTIRKRTNLVGFDVILVHRLLKNPVQIPEYVLMSEELYQAGKSAVPSSAQEVSPDLEGIGPVNAYFVDVESLAGPSLPPLPEVTWSGRLGRTFAAAGLGMPYLLGLRRRREPALAE
jgi:hypothetical protein